MKSYYRRAQQLVRSKRPKALTPKHLELAVFGALRPEGEPWKDTFARWNEAFPDWAYGPAQFRQFSRDCRSARDRLLDPELAD